MGFDDFLPQRLARRLLRPLPGPAAQSLFAPDLNYGRNQIPPFPDTRRAAVLILLYVAQEQWSIPLTVRPENMSAHAGQVSFPGGEVNPLETIERAALREFEEELGVDSAGVTLLGRLTPLYVYASDFLVTPCVGLFPTQLDFKPNAAEVARVLQAPLAELDDPANHGAHWIRHQGVRFRAPHIRLQDHRIWGATRMVLAEFLAIWREVAADA